MSPTAFKQQVSHLLAALTNCHTLCTTIRQTRKLGPTTTALDTLQDTLSISASTLQDTFVTFRTVLGSQFDLGDEYSRHALDRSIREVQSEIEDRLADLAEGKKREKGEVQVPGFGAMTRRWLRIESEVDYALETLGQRIEEARSTPPPKPQRPEQQAKPEKKRSVQHKTDEVVIQLKELDRYVNHMKNSWIEKAVTGKVLYINCFDDKISQWEKPDGFICALPAKEKKKLSRTNTWEEELKAQEKERLRREEQERIWREEQERIRREEEEIKKRAARKAREEERIWEEREMRERELREREQRHRRQQQQGRGVRWEGENGW